MHYVPRVGSSTIQPVASFKKNPQYSGHGTSGISKGKTAPIESSDIAHLSGYLLHMRLSHIEFDFNRSCSVAPPLSGATCGWRQL